MVFKNQDAMMAYNKVKIRDENNILYEKELASRAKTNPKLIWSYIKSK